MKKNARSSRMSIRHLSSSQTVIRYIKERGWILHRIKGSHHQFKHPDKKGTVTVQHPVKDLPVWVVKSILKQAELL